jgi:hypothetical protein
MAVPVQDITHRLLEEITSPITELAAEVPGYAAGQLGEGPVVSQGWDLFADGRVRGGESQRRPSSRPETNALDCKRRHVTR